MEGPRIIRSIINYNESFWDKTLPAARYKYNSLRGIGSLKHVVSLPDKVDYEPKVPFTNSKLQEHQMEFFVKHKSDMVITRPTRTNVDKSVRKMDFEPNNSFRSETYFAQTLSLFNDELKQVWRDEVPLTTEDVLLTIEPKTSPGVIYTDAGFRNKQELISSGVIHGIYNPLITKNPPIWKVAPKVEWKLRHEYVNDDKIRTFIIEPFESLFHRKRLYHTQNMRLKNYKWSAYGFNPYHGGTNLMAKSLNRFRTKFMFDGVKWDRLLPHLDLIYKARNLFVSDPLFRDWVTKASLNSVILLPNGDIVEKCLGNNSGSGNTTVDNILAMLFCVYHAILYISKGDVVWLRNFIIYLFGDDCVGAHNFPIAQDEFEKGFRYIFSLYGISLDPFVQSTSVEDMSFLGFEFTKTPFGYVPKYSLGTLSSSFISEIDKLDDEGQINKLFSLTMMSAGNGEGVYNMFRESLLEILLNTPSTTFSQELLSSGLPDYLDVVSWYLGLEGASDIEHKFNDLNNSFYFFSS